MVRNVDSTSLHGVFQCPPFSRMKVDTFLKRLLIFFILRLFASFSDKLRLRRQLP